MTTTQAPLRRRLTGEKVWTATRWEGDDAWIVELSNEHVAELEAALRSVDAAGLAMGEVGAEQFRLPSLAPVIAGVLDDLEHGRGFVLLRGLPVERYTDEEAAMIYWGIGTHMGSRVAQNADGDLLGHVYDRGYDFAETNVRGYTTNDFLPFHTDGADVVGLLCLRPAKSGGESAIASSLAVHNVMLDEAPDLLERLYREWHFDKRAEVEPDGPPTFTSTIFSEQGDGVRCRYVPGILRSAPEKLGTLMDAQDAAALDLFDEIVNRPGVAFSMDFLAGDMQFLNNHCILHSRREYVDWPEETRRRHLLRLWLTTNGKRG